MKKFNMLRNLRTVFAMGAISCLIFVYGGAVQADPGDLDTTFGSNGIVKVDVDGSALDRDRGTGVAIDGKGKIVVSARAAENSNDADFAVLRFNADGSLDTSFGGDGKVTTDINSNRIDWANAVAIMSNGKIVVAGTHKHDDPYSNAAVVIYDPSNGDIDQQRDLFNDNSKDEIYAVAIDANDKIVIAGRTDSKFYVARLDPALSLDEDSTFNNGSGVAVDFTAGVDIAYAVIIQPDGKILVAGVADDKTANSDFALLRLMPDGTPDASFNPGNNGKLTVDFGNSDGAYAVDIDQTGTVPRIIVAGEAGTSPLVSAFGVTRHLMDSGALDTSFNTTGKSTISLSAGLDRAYGIKTQYDGKYTIAGMSNSPNTDENFAIARLNSDGSADTFFGGTGTVNTDMSGNNTADGAMAVALSSIIAVGFETQTNSVVVAKYQDGLVPNPDANAGADQNLNEGAPVTLDGSESKATEGATITGYLWEQTTGTTVKLSDISTVMPTFTAPYVVPPGETLTFRLWVIDNNGLTANDTVNIAVNDVPANPGANAGPDQVVDEGNLVTLDGSKSEGSGGATITGYLWEQTNGTTVMLSDTSAVKPTFTAPDVDTAGEGLIFRLFVTDSNTLVAADTVAIFVGDVSTDVKANAGKDQIVNEGTPVSLDGSGSSATGGATIASYAWVQTTGTAVTLSDASVVRPTFTAPDVTAPGELLSFQLTVTDNSGLTASDMVNIVVADDSTSPQANAGGDQTVNEETPVTLDGSGSSGTNGATITGYLWEQTGGTAVTLSDTSAAKPTFTSPAVEANGMLLTFRLTVTDSNGLTAFDTVDVNVADKPKNGSGGGGGGGGGCFISSMGFGE